LQPDRLDESPLPQAGQLVDHRIAARSPGGDMRRGNMMPMVHPCIRPGCGTLTMGEYCLDHEQLDHEQQEDLRVSLDEEVSLSKVRLVASFDTEPEPS
jgi:hypothetical protein